MHVIWEVGDAFQSDDIIHRQTRKSRHVWLGGQSVRNDTAFSKPRTQPQQTSLILLVMVE